MSLHMQIVCSMHMMNSKTEGGNLGDLTSDLCGQKATLESVLYNCGVL